MKQILTLVLFDQLTKFIFFKYSVINFGYGFGLDIGGQFALLVLPTIAFILTKNKLIKAGILGNLLNRIFLGYVPDFLYFGPIVCNLADIYISIGIVQLILYKREK